MKRGLGQGLDALFAQTVTPDAVFDKWTRTQAALHGGADLVLELPTAFATRSAGYFARGAVLTLAATGVVSHLSCGVETSDGQDIASALYQIATLLAEEPEPYQAALQQSIGQGLAFPQARQKALQELNIPGVNLLDTPNPSKLLILLRAAKWPFAKSTT